MSTYHKTACVELKFARGSVIKNKHLAKTCSFMNKLQGSKEIMLPRLNEPADLIDENINSVGQCPASPRMTQKLFHNVYLMDALSSIKTTCVIDIQFDDDAHIICTPVIGDIYMVEIESEIASVCLFLNAYSSMYAVHYYESSKILKKLSNMYLKKRSVLSRGLKLVSMKKFAKKETEYFDLIRDIACRIKVKHELGDDDSKIRDGLLVI